MEGLALNLLPDDLDVSSGQTSPSASSLQDLKLYILWFSLNSRGSKLWISSSNYINHKFSKLYFEARSQEVIIIKEIHNTCKYFIIIIISTEFPRHWI